MLVGCGDQLAGPPADMPLDIVVGNGIVQIFTGGADRRPCDCTSEQFPAQGTCYFHTDAKGCVLPDATATCESCFTFAAIEADGVQIVGRRIGGDPPQLVFEPTEAQLTLVLEGCDRDVARIPLGGGPWLTPSVSASWDDTNTPIVSWAVPAEPTSVVVTLATWHGLSCHVLAGDSYRFTGYENDVYVYGGRVQTFDTHFSMKTSYGIVNVWRGGEGFDDL